MEGTLKQILKELKDLKQEATNIKEGQERLEANLLSELRSNFKYTNDKIDEHHNNFGVISDEINSMKVDIEYLSSKTVRHDTEMNNVMNRLKS